MNENGKEFAVTDLLTILWMHKFLIVTLACLVATGLLVKTVYFTEPQYVADGMLYVSNKDEMLLQDRIQQSDIYSSRTLSETYIEILQSRSFLTDVSIATNQKYSWKEIKSMTKISSVNETELLTISVKANNSEDACAIAAAILDKSKDKLISVLNGGDVTIVDPVDSAATLVDAGATRKTILGFALGAFIGAVIAFLRNLFDKKVHKGDDVAKRYNISVLGNISR